MNRSRFVRSLLALGGLAVLAGLTPAPGLAGDIGLPKANTLVTPPPPDPATIRQGGDTFADALLLELPNVHLTGSTVGYTDDYDEACPYTGSTSPDVVYRLAPRYDATVEIDMLGSAYDTKIYVYRENFTLVACNDDYYPDYVSRLENVELERDTKYFLVIDGYGGVAGDYELTIFEWAACDVECPAGFRAEDEPPLVDGYLDYHNGGCDSADLGVTPFMTLSDEGTCGTSGWYVSGAGEPRRDTDWFEVQIPAPYGYLMIMADAEYETVLYQVSPTDCGSIEVVSESVVGPCSESELMVVGDPGEIAWFWVGPAALTGATGEYDYWLLGSYPVEPTVEASARSWAEIKAMFR